MRDLEQELETIDPLNYRQVKYHKHEWDNIPPVVPKFIINLSKYVEGLSNWANFESKIETVPHLRGFSEKQIQVREQIYNHTLAN